MLYIYAKDICYIYMLIEMVNLFFKITYKRFESASTYFSMRIKLFNLQIKPIFAFAFIFVHVPWEQLFPGGTAPPPLYSK